MKKKKFKREETFSRGDENISKWGETFFMGDVKFYKRE